MATSRKTVIVHLGPKPRGPKGVEVLSAAERRRATAFIFAADRELYEGAHRLLREVVGRELGRNPAALRFRRGRSGKPTIVHAQGLELNLTHSGKKAAVAFARFRRVGIDLEQVARFRNLKAFLHVLSAAERAQVERAPAKRQAQLFARIWVRKEAFIKAVGKGLGIRLSQLDVLGPRPVLKWRGKSFLLRDLRIGTGYVAAVAAEGSDWKLRVHQ